jgi:hypothetical protein
MYDLKLHVSPLHDKAFHVLTGPAVVIPLVLGIAAITAAAFYLNAVFAYAIIQPGRPQIRPAFTRARSHLGVVLGRACPASRVRSGTTSRPHWRTPMVLDGSPGRPGQPASGPGEPPGGRRAGVKTHDRPRFGPRVRHGIEAAEEKYSGSAAEDLWHRLDAVDFMNQAMILTGTLLLCALPFLLATSGRPPAERNG